MKGEMNMLKFTNQGIIFNNKMYKMSAGDMAWVKAQNKANPTAHPARDLKGLALEIIELD